MDPQTLQAMNSMSDEELIAQGISPDNIARIRASVAPAPQVQAQAVPIQPVMAIPPPQIQTAPVEPVYINNDPAMTVMDNGQIVDEERNAEKARGRAMLDKQRQAAAKAEERRQQKQREEEEKQQKTAQRLGLGADEFKAIKGQLFGGEEGAMPPPTGETETEITKEEEQGFVNQFERAMYGLAQEKDANNRLESMMAEFDRKLKDLEERKIDPDRFWKSKTDGERTRLAWAIALGSFGKNGNAALQIINQNIQNDIAAQKEELDKEYKMLAHQKDRLQLAAKLSKEGPPNVRLLKHEIDLLNASIAQGKQLAGKPKANQEAFSQMLSQLEMRKQQKFAQLSEAVRNQKGQLSDDLIDGDTPLAWLSEKQLARFVPGWGLATDRASKQKFLDFANDAEGALAGIERAKELATKFHKLNFLDPERAKIKAELTALAGQLRLPYTGPGVLTDAEYERLRDAIGDPSKILSFSHLELAKLDTATTKLKNDLNVRAKNAGLPVRNTTFKSFKASE